jgi:hypothetical protein
LALLIDERDGRRASTETKLQDNEANARLEKDLLVVAMCPGDLEATGYFALIADYESLARPAGYGPLDWSRQVVDSFIRDRL